MNGFSAKVTLSATRLSLLEPLKITLELDYPEGYQPDLEALRSNLAKEFILLDEKVEPHKIEWSVAAETPGKKVVAFYAIPFHAEGKENLEIISNLYPVEITLPEIDLSYSGKLAPLQTFSKMPELTLSMQNIALEAPDRHAEKIAAKTIPSGLLLLLLSIAVLGALLRSFRNRIPVEKKEPAATALGSLEQISIEPLPEREYYEKMSRIVRRFIEENYHFKAPANTSQECLEKLKLNKEQHDILATFFKAADSVSYAEHHPSDEERKAALSLARRFIQGSKYDTFS